MSEMAQTLLSVFLSMEQNVEEQSWSLCTLSLGYMFGLTLTPAHESHHGKWPGWLESKRSFHGWIFYGGAVTEAAAARRGRGRFVFPFFKKTKNVSLWDNRLLGRATHLETHLQKRSRGRLSLSASGFLSEGLLFRVWGVRESQNLREVWAPLLRMISECLSHGSLKTMWHPCLPPSWAQPPPPTPASFSLVDKDPYITSPTQRLNKQRSAIRSMKWQNISFKTGQWSISSVIQVISMWCHINTDTWLTEHWTVLRPATGSWSYLPSDR